MDKIHIQELAFYGYHGALPEENVLGQTYRVSLTFELDTREAGRTDDLQRTIDYRQAIGIVREVVTGPPHKLIETVADLIATRLLLQLPLARAVTVRLTKPNPPVGMELAGVTIEIRRERQDG
jgi:7,8-dihydroneopterin aldolase/epimerase/oxygenase